MKPLLLAFALIGGPAVADTDDAYRAAMADCFSTFGALALGVGAELNPLGPLVSCAAKPVAVREAEKLPEPERTTAMQMSEVAWTAAGVNNMMVLAGTGAAAPVFGLFVAVGLWAAGEEEREFARLCAVHRQLANNPNLRCEYKKHA